MQLGNWQGKKLLGGRSVKNGMRRPTLWAVGEKACFEWPPRSPLPVSAEDLVLRADSSLCMTSAYGSKLLLHLGKLSWSWDHGKPIFLIAHPKWFPTWLVFFYDPKMMLRRWSGWAGEWWNLVMFQEKHSSTMWVRDGQYKTQKKIHNSCSSPSSQHLGQGLTQTCSTKLVTNIMPILAQSLPRPGNQNMWWSPEKWPWTNTSFVLCEQQWLEDKESLQ